MGAARVKHFLAMRKAQVGRRVELLYVFSGQYGKRRGLRDFCEQLGARVKDVEEKSCSTNGMVSDLFWA